MATTTRSKKEEHMVKPTPTATDKNILKAVLKNGTLLEVVMNDETGMTKLVVAEQEQTLLVDCYTHPVTGIKYYPMQDEGFIDGKVILPVLTKIEDLSVNRISVDELTSDMSAFIHRYADIDEISENLCALFCLNTWVYDKYEKVPYLRLLGTKETGKSRLKKVLGRISYHTLDIGYGMTEAGLFRSIAKYQQGTMLIDEANLADSSLFSGFVKILNGGYEQGTVITRCRPNDYEPETFAVFCPKILSNHTFFDDLALESRMHTIITYATQRKDIPESLSGTTFEEEAKVLQVKLLAFRLQNYNSIDCQKQFQGMDKYSPRLREITLPLLRTAGYNVIPAQVIAFLDRQLSFNQELAADTPEVMIANVLCQFIDTGLDKVFVNDVTSQVNHLSESTYSTRYIGEMIKIMRIPKSRKTNGFQVDLSKVNVIELRKRYSLAG